ncbi:hypothetical protein NFJ02_06g126320 [Pycnococcus provasolii]
MATPSKIVALVGLSVVTLAVGVNAKPYGGGNGGYYGKYGGSKYGGVSDSYDDGYYKGSKYGGVSDSYDDGYYKGSKYGGYGYNAPKPKVSWWKPWSWKYAKKSYSYGDEYEYGYDNGLTKACLREAAHAYVGLSETLKLDEFRAIPMTPGTTTATTTTTAIPNKDPNQFQCTCGCNVGHQAFACITFIFDKDGNEVPNPDASAIQTVYQPVEKNKFIGTSQKILTEFNPVEQDQKATTRLQGTSMPHYAGGMRINTNTATSVQFNDPGNPLNNPFLAARLTAPFTVVQKQDKVTCFGPERVIDECATRCDRAVDEKLLTENEFVHKCDTAGLGQEELTSPTRGTRRLMMFEQIDIRATRDTVSACLG